jgi:hypothetical protein
MAMSPDPRRRDTRNTPPGEQPRDPAPLGNMQEPLGTTGRPVSRTSDDNDVNLANTRTGRTNGITGTTDGADRRAGRGFTTTFAVIAAVLLAAFLVALYLGAEGTNLVTAPTEPVAPVADAPPATPGDATGSTTPVEPTEPAPGTTAPAN